MTGTRSIRPRWATLAAWSATLFGVATILVGGQTLIADPAVAGDIVPFVLWFNFVAGFVYVAAAVALLMVSRIPYKRFHRAYLLGRQPFGQVLFIMLVFAVFWSYKAPTLLVITLWYGLSGPIFFLSRMLRERRLAATTAAPPLAMGGLGGGRSPADSGSPASEKSRAV